jgi:LuxR family transcriptional regulator of csgAB operon
VTIKEISVDETEPVLKPKMARPTYPPTDSAKHSVEAKFDSGELSAMSVMDEIVSNSSEEPLPPIEEVDGITLFSVANSLQTGLLANLISAQTGLPCAVETCFTNRISHVSLALVDCQTCSFNELQALIRSIQDHTTELRVALLNAVQETEHEELLDWPCIVGVFFDDTDQEQLNRGLHSLLNGEYWVPRRLLHHFLQKNRRAPSASRLAIKLTKRERQILKLIKSGATNSDIAKVLDVSEHTVKSHLYNVYKKIGVRNRLEANNWVRDIDNI